MPSANVRRIHSGTTTTPPTARLNRRLEVEITAEVIEAATRADSSHCMIADAIKAQVPGAERIAVDLQSIRYTDRKRGVRYLYLTPARAQVALLRFDQGETVEPFVVKSPRPAQVTAAATSRLTVDEEGNRVVKETQPSRRKAIAKGRPGAAPTVTGGALPPNGALSNARGKRREFGLRQLKP
jgi:hypothetical protein